MFTSGRRVNRLSILSLAFILPGLRPSSHPAQAQTSAPTFNRDIAPILFQNCSVCHRKGGAGPFPLLTYEDVKRHRRQIVSVTQSGFMPPWLPQAGYGKFQDERRLTSEQIKTIALWVHAGAQEGSPGDLPPVPDFEDVWQLGKPDLIVTANSPLRVPPSGPDVFWNFTFKPDLAGTRYIKAIDIEPAGAPDGKCETCSSESARLVHHANALIDRTGSVARLEAKPGAGFSGMEFNLDRNPFDPESHFLFWKPGNTPYFEPEGLSWRLDPGNELVLNTHLQPNGKPETIQPAIGLYFTDKPPTRLPLLLELENDNALDIPAGDRAFVVSDDFKLPLDVDVLASYPHAHFLGKLLEAYATLPDGRRIWLIRIPDWNFDWQAVYRYQQPVFLPKGAVVSMRFHYDNSAENPRNPNSPPKRVRTGNNASDEMGHLWLQVLPRGRGDRRRELEEALVRHRLEKSPDNFAAHLDLGALLLSRLHTQEAVGELETAIRLDGLRSEPHDMLGSALRSLGRYRDAIAEYRLALRDDPNSMNARYDLAVTLARTGNLREAIADFQQVIDAFPKSSRLQNEFGRMLAGNGDLEKAVERFSAALELDPSNQEALKNRDSVEQKLNGQAAQ